MSTAPEVGIKLAKPQTKNPNINKRTRNASNTNDYPNIMIRKHRTAAKIADTKETGDLLFWKILSETKPRNILPTIPPASKAVEAFAAC